MLRLLFILFFMLTITDEALPDEAAAVGSDQTAVGFLSDYVPNLFGRFIKGKDYIEVQQDGLESFVPRIDAFYGDPSKNLFLSEPFAEFIEISLATGGELSESQRAPADKQRDDIDYTRVGKIVRHVINNEKPLVEILTAEYCWKENPQGDSEIVQCSPEDTGRTGVLETRSFLRTSAGRYSIHRVTTTINKFLCLEFPLDINRQPQISGQYLLPKFAKLHDSNDANGNGSGCYSCHSQFAAFAQHFNHYDNFGNKVDASIKALLHDDSFKEDGGIARSEDGVVYYSSHFKSKSGSGPFHSETESVRIFSNTQVSSLGEMVQEIAKQPEFRRCMIERFISHSMPRVQQEVGSLGSLSRRIADHLKENIEGLSADDKTSLPTFTYPQMIKAILQNTTVRWALGERSNQANLDQESTEAEEEGEP